MHQEKTLHNSIVIVKPVNRHLGSRPSLGVVGVVVSPVGILEAPQALDVRAAGHYHDGAEQEEGGDGADGYAKDLPAAKPISKIIS